MGVMSIPCFGQNGDGTAAAARVRLAGKAKLAPLGFVWRKCVTGLLVGFAWPKLTKLPLGLVRPQSCTGLLPGSFGENAASLRVARCGLHFDGAASLEAANKCNCSEREIGLSVNNRKNTGELSTWRRAGGLGQEAEGTCRAPGFVWPACNWAASRVSFCRVRLARSVSEGARASATVRSARCRCWRGQQLCKRVPERGGRPAEAWRYEAKLIFSWM